MRQQREMVKHSLLSGIGVIIIAGYLLLTTSYSQSGQPQTGGYPRSGAGTMELTVTPLKDENPDMRRDLVLFQAVSDDGAEYYEIHIAAEDMIVLRAFGRCNRSGARIQHNFRKGIPVRIGLAWNRESTRLYINGRETDEFFLTSIDDFSNRRPILRVGGSEYYRVTDVSVSSRVSIPVAAADHKFVQENKCPDTAQLLKPDIQEKYLHIGLQNFPDQRSRKLIKGYIDVLPLRVAGAIRRIIFVDEGRYQSPAWKGKAYYQNQTILLQSGVIQHPGTFFHEAAHLYDYSGYLATGTFRNEKWERRFMPANEKPVREASSLMSMDASNPWEQLAGMVGRVYELYLGGSRAEIARFAGERQNMDKLTFLLEEGFINRPIYDRFSAAGEKAR